MAGLYGIFTDSPIDYSFVSQIEQSMAHRGSFTRRNDVVSVLGCTEFSAAHWIRDTHKIIAWDGRLDNREDLYKSLRAYYPLSADSPDSEYALASYLIWKDKSPEHLRGDFAFAIWDFSSRSLFLARDVFGARPLYYCQLPSGGLCIASEIKSFFQIPAVKRSPNPILIAGLLVGENQDSAATFFKDIFQLPAGSCAEWSFQLREPRRRQYWKFPVDPLKDVSSCEEEFLRLFRKSITARLSKIGPTGSLFSGGLDSTQITFGAAEACAQMGQGRRLLPLLWKTPEYFKEEQGALESLQKIYGVSALIVPREQAEPERTNFEYYLEVGETPHPESFTAGRFLLDYFAQNGCQNVMIGLGGNEISNFSEIGHLEDLLCRGEFFNLHRELKQVSRTFGFSEISAAKWIFHETLREFLPYSIRKFWRRHHHNRLFWMRNPLKEALPKNPKEKSRTFPTLSQELCWRQISDPWLSLSLNQVGEAGARAGVTMVYPFLDRDLVEFLLRIPGAKKVEHGYRKMFLQSALLPIVQMPLRVQDPERTVSDDSTAKRENTQDFQRNRLKYYLSDSQSLLYNYVDYHDIQRMLQPSYKNFWDHYPMLWRLVRLKFWFRDHFNS